MRSCFLQKLSHQMLDSGAPDIQIQTPKSLKNVTCKHACQKTQLLCQSWPKRPNGGPEILPKSIEIQAWTPKVSFRVLPSPPASLDGPPRCQIRCNEHAKWHVLGTKFDNIRAPIHRELKNTWRRNCIQTSASQHTFQQRYFKKHATNYKLKVKGAGGMGEALR